MPPIRTARNRKPPPNGFDDIEDTLLEFSNKMKDAENASHEGKKRHEVLWPIFQISHQRELSFPRLPNIPFSAWVKRNFLSGDGCKLLLTKTGWFFQGHDIYMICTTRRKQYQNSCTTGCSRITTQMPI